MAKVMPFKGVRYNTSRIQEIGRAVCPPYDVISPDGQEHYYQRHEYNMIRLELGKAFPEDTPSQNRHTRASDYLAEWMKKEVLVRDSSPCLYLYHMTYRHPQEGPKTLKGFLAAVRIEDPEAGQILPHEWTLPKAKQDRLELLRACHANTSPIFMLYSDPENSLLARLEEAAPQDRPAVRFAWEDGIDHRLWLISDPKATETVGERLISQPLFIADGHHRYETALAFRNEMRARSKDPSPQPYDFVLTFLTGMSEPGISLLPIHRVILHPMPCDLPTLLGRLEQFFAIRSFEFSDSNETGVRSRLFEEMKRRGRSSTVFGLYAGGEKCYRLLEFKGKRTGQKPVERLDVALFQRHVLEEAFGMEDNAAQKEARIQFIKDESAAIQTVRNGTAGAAFFLNPTRVDQVREVVLSGDRMPQKSTYFYPKPLTGLVLNVFDRA